jgi:hypothetical protein
MFVYHGDARAGQPCHYETVHAAGYHLRYGRVPHRVDHHVSGQSSLQHRLLKRLFPAFLGPRQTIGPRQQRRLPNLAEARFPEEPDCLGGQRDDASPRLAFTRQRS